MLFVNVQSPSNLKRKKLSVRVKAVYLEVHSGCILWLKYFHVTFQLQWYKNILTVIS